MALSIWRINAKAAAYERAAGGGVNRGEEICYFEMRIMASAYQ
jgi:hypothetical protein